MAPTDLLRRMELTLSFAPSLRCLFGDPTYAWGKGADVGFRKGRPSLCLAEILKVRSSLSAALVRKNWKLLLDDMIPRWLKGVGDPSDHIADASSKRGALVAAAAKLLATAGPSRKR